MTKMMNCKWGGLLGKPTKGFVEDNVHNSSIGNSAMPMVEMLQCLIIKRVGG
jgi:hypothetical protein